MNAYRDQYAQIFNGGKGLTVLAVSVDADTVHANWAKDADYPVTFVSDTGRTLGPVYSVMPAGRTSYARVLFVIGKDGRIAHVMRPFRELVQDSYDELGRAVTTALAK